MKAGRKRQMLTEKEAQIMQMLWSRGPMFVREMVEIYPEPKPHVNTVSTTVRILEDKGYVSHESVGGSHRYYAVARMEDFRERSLTDLVLFQQFLQVSGVGSGRGRENLCRRAPRDNRPHRTQTKHLTPWAHFSPTPSTLPSSWLCSI